MVRKARRKKRRLKERKEEEKKRSIGPIVLLILSMIMLALSITLFAWFIMSEANLSEILRI